MYEKKIILRKIAYVIHAFKLIVLNIKHYANLRFLVDKIIITEKNKKLNIKIRLNAKFQKHKDCYDEDGNLRGRAFTA